MKISVTFLLGLFLFTLTSAIAQPPTELFLRGYSVLPAPQKVELQSGDLEFNDAWGYDASKITKDHIAVRSLLRDLREFHSIELKPISNQTKNVMRLSVSKGAVQMHRRRT